MTKTTTLVALLLMTAACAGGAQEVLIEDPELRARLEPLATRAMERGLIPGLQVAVVMADGRTWTGSFGTADMATGRPVTNESRFYIASTTKALTALAAAQVAGRGDLDLDANLSEAFPPGTRFHPDYEPEGSTVRDLLTHTHGLRQGIIGFRTAFSGEITNDDLRTLLVHHPPLPNRDFRYSNFGYDLVGYLLAPDVEDGWKAIVEREVLEPLGMTHTTAMRSTIPDSLIAWPHEVGPGGMERIRLGKGDANLGPAGGHFTTATDLARLLLAEMNEGRLAGLQAIPATVIAETQRAQVPQERTFAQYTRHAWGLGWDIGTVSGDTVIHRPGGFSGYYSNAAFLPEHGFGVVVLANGGMFGSRVAEAVAGTIYDELRGRDGGTSRLDDTLDELQISMEDRRQQLAAMWQGVERQRLAAPPRPIDAYAGTYVEELWGSGVVVAAEDGTLLVRFGMVESSLVPVEGDGEGDAFFTQIIDSDDQITFLFEGSGSRATGFRIRGLPEVYTRRD